MYTNFVELESPMLHAKFLDHSNTGFEEEDVKGLYHIWPWPPSWSCYQDDNFKFMFPLLKNDLYKFEKNVNLLQVFPFD